MLIYIWNTGDYGVMEVVSFCLANLYITFIIIWNMS